VDVNTRRSGGLNQAEEIARKLGYRWAFASAMSRDGGEYGVALVSRLPLQRVERLDLRSPGALEPRTALDVTVCAGMVPIRVVALHADVLPWSAADNVRLLAKQLPGNPVRTVIAGDLNASPDEDGPVTLGKRGLFDVIGQRAEGPTFHFPGPRRLDYIFADRSLADDGSTAGRTESEMSDHWPIHAELAWPVN
jgi:endonuclease/exonuclease/phosphatase family metal-dependent hydrolase